MNEGSCAHGILLKFTCPVCLARDHCTKCGKPVTLGDGKTQSDWGENIRCYPNCGSIRPAKSGPTL